MIDERDILEQELRRFEPEPGLADRVYRRRDRKRRNQRVEAGIVGVIVALATAILLARSFTSATVPANMPLPPPAASGTLAYALDGDIFVADPDGSNAVKIADGRPPSECRGSDGKAGDLEYWFEGSIWSPDGRYLAFRRADCDAAGGIHSTVVISDVQGNLLGTFPAAGWDIGWSPDSTRVAVWDTWPKTVGVYGLDGARQTELPIPPGSHGGGDNDPLWMPDGTSLTVGDLEVPLDGSAPRKIPDGSYSPDGTHVAEVADRSLTIAQADGSERQEVFTGRVLWYAGWAWAPDGDRIAFITDGAGPGTTETGLRLLDVATGSVTLLTEAPDGASIGVIGFSPQSDRILLWKEADGGDRGLWSIGVDGSDFRHVVAGTEEGEWLSR